MADARAAGRQNPYEVLGVPTTASQAEIKRAYMRLARQWHPDKNEDCRKADCERMFKAIAEAYDTLGDPAKRAEFDRLGSSAAAGGSAAFGRRFSFAKADAMFHDIFASMHGMGFGEDMRRLRREDAMPSGYSRRPAQPVSFDDIFSLLESAVGQLAEIESPSGGGSCAGFSSAWGSSAYRGATGHASVSTRTDICSMGGRTFTRTVTTRRHPDGRVETTADEAGSRDLESMPSGMDRLSIAGPAGRHASSVMPARRHAPTVAAAVHERGRSAAARRDQRRFGTPGAHPFGGV